MGIEDLIKLAQSKGIQTRIIPQSAVPEIQGYGKPKTLTSGGGMYKLSETAEEAKAKQLELKEKQLDIAKKQKEFQQSGKIPVAQLGYYTMATASMKDYGELMKKIDKGEIKYTDIKNAFFKTPTDLTSEINTKLYAASDAWLRIQTGAQANPSEIQREMAKYQPRPWDSDKAIKMKLKSLFEDRLGLYRQTLEENTGGKKEARGISSPKPSKTKPDPLGVF